MIVLEDEEELGVAGAGGITAGGGGESPSRQKDGNALKSKRP